MGKQLDTWLRWSHQVSGWLWSVMDGADVVEEGATPSYDEATKLAEAALAKQSAKRGKAYIGVDRINATVTPAEIKIIRAKQNAFLRSL
jgi:hypothetical protein